jgi:hypothetical protein
MRRAAAALLLVACGTRATSGAPSPEPEAAPPPGVPVGIASADVPVPKAMPLPPRTVELAVADGDLATQLGAQVARAKEQGLVPFVQIYAEWCASCRKLRGAMDDPRMQEAFRGTWVVRLSADAWGGELQQGLWVRDGLSVPAFHVLTDDGTLGPRIDGSAWGADVVENMAPKLQAYFRANGAAGG